MVRERRVYENLTARFATGTMARIERALRGRESKADFIRSAVDAKLRERERHRSAESDPHDSVAQ